MPGSTGEKLRTSGDQGVKSERLEARLTAEQKALLQHAADLLGRSLTDFVLSALTVEAERVIREREVITLTARDSRAFVEAVLHPAAPTESLRESSERHRKLLVTES
ncbi:MAG TPA: DUF1778 domain-containing protein [Chloroflexota bacterium]|nr:DUF1778 domain-containing protein [Chloroflexota bacterium]